MHANIKSRQNANSSVKIRSRQQLVTPPEGGSFKQLTSTRNERKIKLMRTLNERKEKKKKTEGNT